MSKKVFNMAGGKHSAAAYAAFENRMFGSCKASPTSFVVSAGSGMNASISAGDGLIDTGNNYARRIQTDAAETVAVAAASGSFNRIDSIVAYIDTDVTPTTSVTDNTNDVLKFASVAGTAASTPVAPTGAAILSAIGAGKPYMILANVLVPQSAANLSGATFTNMAAIARDPSGWQLVQDAWAYSSYSSTARNGVVTVPSDATTKYSIGMKVKLTQATGGTKYARIVSLTSTTLTLFMLNGATLNNEAINGVYYSTSDTPYAPSPVDFKEPTPWQSVSYANSWVDFGESYETTQYRKNIAGMVEIKGFIKSGTTAPGTTIFTLPAGYRPHKWNYYPVTLSSGSAGSVELRDNGVFSTVSVNNTYTGLGRIVFSADN